MLGPFEEDATTSQREAMVLGVKLKRRSRFFSRENLWVVGPAKTLHRTGRTFGPDAADKRAQFHKGGIMLAGVAAGEELRGGGPEPLAAGTRVDRRLQVEDAGKDAGDVRFDDRNR